MASLHLWNGRVDAVIEKGVAGGSGDEEAREKEMKGGDLWGDDLDSSSVRQAGEKKERVETGRGACSYPIFFFSCVLQMCTYSYVLRFDFVTSILPV